MALNLARSLHALYFGNMFIRLPHCRLSLPPFPLLGLHPGLPLRGSVDCFQSFLSIVHSRNTKVVPFSTVDEIGRHHGCR